MKLFFVHRIRFHSTSIIGIMLVMVTLLLPSCLLPAMAEAADAERDPFFTAGPRSAAKEAASQDADWGRDPFNRPFPGKAQSAAPSADRGREGGLSGIISGGTVRLAIINGEAYKEGSVIGEQKLISIRSRSIVLMNRAGAREEVFLEDFSFRK